MKRIQTQPMLKGSLLMFLQLTLALAMAQSSFSQFYNQRSEYLKANGIWTLPSQSTSSLVSVGDSSIGLNFNDPSSFYFYSAMDHNTPEGLATVAHPITGELLFYSNGGKVWNKNHSIMPNGDNLKGNGDTDYSTAQGVLAVPFAEDYSKYYLFSMTTAAYVAVNRQPMTYLYYSVIDMTLDSGRGDIVVGAKSILLDSGLSEAMISIPACDKIWLLLHENGSHNFKAYKITAQGIMNNPIISTTGNQIQGSGSVSLFGGLIQDTYEAYNQSNMAISPNRKKIALTTTHISAVLGGLVNASGWLNGVLVGDFDYNAGSVSNAFLLDSAAAYGVAFSPDNTKLYIGFAPAMEIYQYDLSSNDTIAIRASKAHISTSSSELSSLKLYNDTIYCATSGRFFLDRINHPNALGTLCDYEQNAIRFLANDSTEVASNLPNDVTHIVPPDTMWFTRIDTICNWDEGLDLQPNQNNGENFSWSDGTSNATLEISDSGTYWVQYQIGCDVQLDTFIIRGVDLDPVIRVDSFILSTGRRYQSYQWVFNGSILPGATDSALIVTQNGDYQVIVSDGSCIDTSAIYPVNNTSIPDTKLPPTIQFYPNPTSGKVYITSPERVDVNITSIDGKLIRHIKKARQFSLHDCGPGLYLVHFLDDKGSILKVEKLALVK